MYDLERRTTTRLLYELWMGSKLWEEEGQILTRADGAWRVLRMVKRE